MPESSRCHRARRAPGPGARVVQLGERERSDPKAPCDEDLASGKQSGRVVGALNAHRTDCDPRGIEQGREVRAVDYLRALGRVPELNASLTELFEQRYDAILTPAAFGTAPKGLESTGDPAFCALWTLCGMPALNVPLMQGANGLPLGVQLVGARHRDAQLLRTARWLVTHLSNP